MKEPNPQTIYLKDYQPLPYKIAHVDLYFDIRGASEVRVAATTKWELKEGEALHTPLQLMGEFFELESLRIDGAPLDAASFVKNTHCLTLVSPPATFTLEVITRLNPQANTALEGLYQSGQILCTQNEAEGFRRITYYLDRPDAMSVFTTHIEADKKLFPLLLANGNLTESKDKAGGRHVVTWEDPFPKPCYLFALVAGDLGMIEDRFRTRSGRNVKLQVFVDRGDEDRAHHSLESLKRAMAWDEARFGLEYDLDIYMIVAVSSFNAGAMENKGLNIFNSKYVLASTDTATDSEFLAIESVVGHEYFHNWTGNRVTCRDWFQLSLKEGLTVYRDQEFTSDLHSRAVKRIEEVNMLRTHQFAEDAGPMAHPIRPHAYIEINNFYTLTVYEKGSEVVRMIETLIGRENFRLGIDKYFELFDGQAVTTEDFVHAMEVASGHDLTQFKRWYDQAGTPEISYRQNFDSASGTYTLTLSQTCPPTPGQREKLPFHIPVKIGLVGPSGKDLPFTFEGKDHSSSIVLSLVKAEQDFKLTGVKEKPVLSILREFSAPVRLKNVRPSDELIFLLAHDSDSFSQWEAGQSLYLQNLQNGLHTGAPVDPWFVEALGQVIRSKNIDAAFKSLLLEVPDLNFILQFEENFDPARFTEVRDNLIRTVAEKYRPELESFVFTPATSTDFSQAAATRRLRGAALSYLLQLKDDHLTERVKALYDAADNMTDRMATLNYLNHTDSPEREAALSEFYERYRDDALTMTKWLSLQGRADVGDIHTRIAEVTKDPVFDPLVPNCCYALLVAFGTYNSTGFHDPSGKGYRFLADWVIEIEKNNPSVASRMARLFNQWKKIEPRRREFMRLELQRIFDVKGLSPNVFEIVSRALC